MRAPGPSAGRLAGALALSLVAACAAVPPSTVDPATRQSLGRIAVVASGTEPRIELAGIPSGKGHAAAQGAWLGVECAGRSTELGAAALLMWVIVCPAVTVVGSVAGAASAESREAVDAGRARLQEAGATYAVQRALREQVARRAHAELGERYIEIVPRESPVAWPGADYAGLAPLGADSVLEASIAYIGTRSDGGFNPPLEIVVEASVRLIRAADNNVVFDEKFDFAGARRRLADWIKDDARPLRAELERAYAELGRHIVEQTLLLYPYPGNDFENAFRQPYGLAAIEPRTRGLVVEGPFDGFQWSKVESLTPLLRWEAFPRARDRAARGADMGRVTNVSYDLVIAGKHDQLPAQVIYRRERLPVAEHRVEQALEAGSRYFWSVRARFELDGATYLTDWAGVMPGRGHIAVPNRLSYRFATP
jgi:hypothetical protein